jgi:predicted DsbA family dithiol-disulfide isomerase
MSDLFVEVISDFNCPWCEVGRVRLKRALEQYSPSGKYIVRWKPFLLYDIPQGGLKWKDHMVISFC